MTFAPSCVLVTGGAGFIGSNFVRWVLKRAATVRVINFDLLTYAGNLESLEDVATTHGPQGDGRYYFLRGDVRDFETVRSLLQGNAYETLTEGSPPRRIPAPDCVVHMAAESHVDRSIMGPGVFVDTNVRGTLVLLEACRAEITAGDHRPRFVHVSTDEVYGSLGPSDPPFTEQTALAPRSPYSASKAGSDMLVQAYIETFSLPALITRCSNNYGPYQFPEKLIPLAITRALRDEPVPVYGDGLNVRDWLYIDDHAEALWAALTRGKIGSVYNLGGENELANLDLVQRLLQLLGKPDSLIRFVPDRLGHDRRYAMDISRARGELGWTPGHDFDDGLQATVGWYVKHRSWWERVLSEAYRTATGMYLIDG